MAHVLKVVHNGVMTYKRAYVGGCQNCGPFLAR